MALQFLIDVICYSHISGLNCRKLWWGLNNNLDIQSGNPEAFSPMHAFYFLALTGSFLEHYYFRLKHTLCWLFLMQSPQAQKLKARERFLGPAQQCELELQQQVCWRACLSLDLSRCLFSLTSSHLVFQQPACMLTVVLSQNPNSLFIQGCTLLGSSSFSLTCCLPSLKTSKVNTAQHIFL